MVEVNQKDRLSILMIFVTGIYKLITKAKVGECYQFSSQRVFINKEDC